MVGGQPRLSAPAELPQEELDRLAAAAICRVSDAFARDPSSVSIEKVLEETTVGIPAVDEVVARFAHYSLVLREGFARCAESQSETSK